MNLRQVLGLYRVSFYYELSRFVDVYSKKHSRDIIICLSVSHNESNNICISIVTQVAALWFKYRDFLHLLSVGLKTYLFDLIVFTVTETAADRGGWSLP